MKPRDYEHLHPSGRRGWSDWQLPVMRGYRMACCDCGLVHELEFRVYKQTKSDGTFTWLSDTPEKDMRVQFRARRHGDTRAMRAAIEFDCVPRRRKARRTGQRSK